MPEEPEIETSDLRETLEELQEERKEREEQEKRTTWTRYIALSTAILAVFAAVGALNSGTKANDAILAQAKASDTWNEYQASRQKDHLYTIEADRLLDAGAAPPDGGSAGDAHRERAKPAPAPEGARAGKEGATPSDGRRAPRKWNPMPPAARLEQYVGQAEKEADKEADLMKEARKLEDESHHNMDVHEQFARSVALIQVAVALGAVAALTRMKWVWFGSLAVGVAGVGFFVAGLLMK